MPRLCQNPLTRRSSETGEVTRKPCNKPSCSQEDRRAWGKRYRARVGDVFTKRPPTHHLRVTVDEDLSFDEVNRLVTAIAKRLAVHGEYYIDFVHFHDGRRHDHFAVRYTGNHPNPEDLFRSIMQRVLVSADVRSHKEVSRRRKGPYAVASYLVKYLGPDRMKNVEMPPDGFKGHLIRATKGIFTKLKKDEPAVVSTISTALPWTRVDNGDQETGEAWELRCEEREARGLESSDQPEVSSRPPGDAATMDHGSTSPDTVRAARQQEAPVATETSSAPIFPRERLHELHEPVRQSFGGRADARDGSLDRFALLSDLQWFVPDGWIVAADDAIDGLVETGFLHESKPGRLVLVAEPSKAA